MGKKPEQLDENLREAERIINRVENESETLGTSSFARQANRFRDHMMADDKEQADAAELWGTRIARGLAIIAFIAMSIWWISYLGR